MITHPMGLRHPVLNWPCGMIVELTFEMFCQWTSLASLSVTSVAPLALTNRSLVSFLVFDTHVYIHIYTYISIYMYILYIHSYPNLGMRVCVCVCRHGFRRGYMYMRMYMSMYMNMYVYECVYPHTHKFIISTSFHLSSYFICVTPP